MNTAHAPNNDRHPLVNVVFPFSINLDPMERLLLVNFQKDPDSVYIGFEPQVFDDEVNGSGHLVIGWRTDKTVDVYYQKSLTLDPAKYSIAGSGLNALCPADFDPAKFEVNANGVHAHYGFTDQYGRKVEILINEQHPRKRKPFGLLAPMGDAATNPQALPLVLLHDFYLVRKQHATINVSIDNKRHVVDELPIPIDWQRMTFIRYSPKPLIATLNPAYNGRLTGFNITAGEPTYAHENQAYNLVWSGDAPAIASFGIQSKVHTLSMRFFPPFPCLNTLADQTQMTGRFELFGHASVGRILGEYTLRSASSSVFIRMVPTKGWKPKITKFSTWLLFTIAAVFKKWPCTYQWDAELKKQPNGAWEMQSSWIRTGKIAKD
jgi:hypothetical protein